LWFVRLPSWDIKEFSISLLFIHVYRTSTLIALQCCIILPGWLLLHVVLVFQKISTTKWSCVLQVTAGKVEVIFVVRIITHELRVFACLV
jgi:hypothetical protein